MNVRRQLLSPRFSRKSIGFLLVLIFMSQLFVACTSESLPQESMMPTDKTQHISQNMLHDRMEYAVKYLQKQPETEWSRFSLSRAGVITSDIDYVRSIANQIKQNGIAWESPTELMRIILTLRALGADPTNLAGMNLIEQLAMDESVQFSSPMSIIFGILALNSGAYVLPENAINTQAILVNRLLKVQNPGAGWSYTQGESSSVDVTAMAITALASAYSTDENVKKRVDQAVEWLSSQQLENGGFSEYGEASESAAQVIIALSSIGIDAQSAAFTKKNNVLHRLLQHQTKSGGFSHFFGKDTTQMSSEQGLQALIAYRLFLDQKGTLYTQLNPGITAQVTVEGPTTTLVSDVTNEQNALDALKQVAKNANLPLVVKESAYGPYVAEIQGIGESGTDGWMFAVERLGNWIYPQTGIGEFTLYTTDHLYVYYGEEAKFINSIQVSPETPKTNESITVLVFQSEWDWDTNQEKITPAIGVQVQIANQIIVTDANGIASFEPIPQAGEVDVTVTGYRENEAPLVLKFSAKLTITEP